MNRRCPHVVFGEVVGKMPSNSSEVPHEPASHVHPQSAAAASALAFPLVGGAQPKPVKVGILHPVTGALAYSGQQCREGALMAIEDINKAGGIKSLGGAKIEALLGDAQSHAAGRRRRGREDERGRRARPWSAPTPRRSAWPPRRRRPSTTCRTWSTSAWPTRSSSAA